MGSVIHKFFSFFPPSCLCRTNLASDYKTLLFNSKNARPKISNKILPREILLQMSYAEGGEGGGGGKVLNLHFKSFFLGYALEIITKKWSSQGHHTR